MAEKSKPEINSEKYGVKKTDDGYKVDAKSLLASIGPEAWQIEVPGLPLGSSS